MNASQKKVMKLLNKETPKEKLKPWVKGYIPKHYKRLSISMEEATELAAEGAAASLAFFGTTLFFTQSLLIGAALSDKYDTINIVTPSQYGKSFTCGQGALLLANRGEPNYVAGADTSTTEIIMNKVTGHIQTADDSLKSKVLETPSKLEKLQTALSKRKLAFRGGGLVEAVSLGDTFSDSKKGNKAIGLGGNFWKDEASKISDDSNAEMGRAEFARVDGKKYLTVNISNPHNPGWFMDAMMDTDPQEGTLIIWMDALTALEEDRFSSREQITKSQFFKNKSTCTRYLLCELEDYSEESMFPEPKVYDGEYSPCTLFYAGVDSAERGKDNIEVTITALDPERGVCPVYTTTISKSTVNEDGEIEEKWKDGKTADAVVKRTAKVLRVYNVRYVCVDIGYGTYLVEGLIKALPGVVIVGINFGSGGTPERKALKHFAAVYAENMRAEMHMDLQNLMEDDKVWFTTSVKDAVVNQLRVIKCAKKPNGKTQVMAKKEIKKIIGRSPDTLDSLLLSVHAVMLDSTCDRPVSIYGLEEGED